MQENMLYNARNTDGVCPQRTEIAERNKEAELIFLCPGNRFQEYCKQADSQQWSGTVLSARF